MTRPTGALPGRDKLTSAQARTRASTQHEFDADTVATVLLRQFTNGMDVGAFLIEAVRRAQLRVAPGFTLTDNRSGSWEADLLRQMIQKGAY